MSKREKRKTEIQPQPVRGEKESFFSMFSKIDSRQKHRIMAYLFWLLGIFIILIAYRAS
jgi:hypothetical protein